jgi:hypothetical protein
MNDCLASNRLHLIKSCNGIIKHKNNTQRKHFLSGFKSNGDALIGEVMIFTRLIRMTLFCQTSKLVQNFRALC